MVQRWTNWAHHATDHATHHAARHAPATPSHERTRSFVTHHLDLIENLLGLLDEGGVPREWAAWGVAEAAAAESAAGSALLFDADAPQGLAEMFSAGRPDVSEADPSA
ncbi:hypothetical protein ABZ642_09890 [Streptomyces sp. NPDC007157]|uniref:hypothetical protein n=1 Tax=Streptomyces sp. NPDC007157 TaxID=3154681 RepID=UPI003406B031